MKVIEVKVEIKNVHIWDVDWGDKIKVEDELRLLKEEIRIAICDRCGVAIKNISAECKLITTPCRQ